MKQFPSRRAFCAGAAALAVGALCGGAARPFSTKADFLRPPGALPESDFAARCIRCERCIDVCPESVLYPLGIESGVLSVRTPSVDYSAGLCTFCDKCREVCPTGAVGAIDPWSPMSGRIGVAVVRPERCLSYLQPGSCGVCEKACEYGAISFDSERKILIDQEKCNGCGACVAVCPANVNTHFDGGQVRGVEVVTEKRFAQEGRS